MAVEAWDGVLNDVVDPDVEQAGPGWEELYAEDEGLQLLDSNGHCLVMVVVHCGRL